MKYLIYLCLLVVICLSSEFNIQCKGSLQADSINEFSQLNNSGILAINAEIEGDYVFGDIDPANSSIAFYDNTSPVCGGDGSNNILIEKYCTYTVDECWDVLIGVGENQLITTNDDGKYINNVIMVNQLPCMPRDTQNFTFGVSDYNGNDIGYANANLNTIENETITTPNSNDLKSQKNKCNIDLIQYIDEWENLKKNQKDVINPISINGITNYGFSLDNLNILTNNDGGLDDVATNADTDLNIDSTLATFQTDYESTLNTSFSTYSNVFGFGGYGSAPTAINLSYLGNQYKFFDVNTFDEHIPMIRDTLLAFSYVWGFVIFSRVSV